MSTDDRVERATSPLAVLAAIGRGGTPSGDGLITGQDNG